METVPKIKKRGRYDCPACGTPILNLAQKGTFFHHTHHCPHCGARMSILRSTLIAPLLMALGVIPHLFINEIGRHETRAEGLVFSIFVLAGLMLLLFNLARFFVKGAYRLAPDVTDKLTGNRYLSPHK